MIETTFVRLLQAADMLGADADTLLIAAAEGRIRAYWMLNEFIQAERGLYEEVEHEPDEPPDLWVSHEFAIKHFMFVPLDRERAAELLRQDSVDLDLDMMTLSTQEADGTFWKAEFSLDDSSRIATRETVFFKRADIEAIGSNGLASAGTIRDPNPSAVNRQRNTLLCILAAALDQAGVDPAERGTASRIAEWTEHIVAPVSADTIKKYLDQIPDALARRSPDS